MVVVSASILLLKKNVSVFFAVMAAQEGSQFDTRQFDTKMDEL